MPENSTIYIVDDDEAVRDSLAALLAANGHRTKTFSSGNEFLGALEPSWRGCIVLDVRMPGLSGPQVQEELAVRKSRLPVIIVTGHGDLPMAVRAMKAGAADFIEKPFEEKVIFESIENALAAAEQIHGEGVAEADLSRRIKQLTPREHEVLVQVAAGHPNKVIAHTLDISSRTVEIHRARVIEKMSARNLSHLVRLTIRAGLLPDEI